MLSVPDVVGRPNTNKFSKNSRPRVADCSSNTVVPQGIVARIRRRVEGNDTAVIEKNYRLCNKGYSWGLKGRNKKKKRARSRIMMLVWFVDGLQNS